MSKSSFTFTSAFEDEDVMARVLVSLYELEAIDIDYFLETNFNWILNSKILINLSRRIDAREV